MGHAIKPKVSIIIPTYNHADFLNKALQSVIDQTFADWETIVVNNHSTDNTVEVVNRFSDERIKLINFNNNGIVAASRNVGVTLAEGDLIAFLDSDDFWYSNKLERCLKDFSPTVDIISHALCVFKNGKFYREKSAGSTKGSSFNSLLYNGNCLTPSAIIMRKCCLEKVGGFSEEPTINTSEDYDLWLKLAKKNFTFLFINEVLGAYLLHDKNLSRSVLQQMNATCKVVKSHFLLMKNKSYLDYLLMKRRKALILYIAARNFQLNRQNAEAFNYFRKSIAIYPFILKVYILLIIGFIVDPYQKIYQIKRFLWKQEKF